MIARVEIHSHLRADRFLTWAEALGQPRPPERSGVKGVAARAVPPRWRPRARVAATAALRPFSSVRARRLRGRDPLRLHVGCGTIYKDGWVNVDLAGTRVDLAWNLARPLPFDDGSVDAIFHEHLLEHLTYAQGIELHRRCLRVLKPGGILRIGVPDAGMVLQGYAMAPPGDAGPWPTPLARVASLTYDSGHRSMYDAETLELSCISAGFVRVTAHRFGEGDLQPSPDSSERGDHTLYVEAIA
jgi:predicted SAM-dependent methyltransferase